MNVDLSAHYDAKFFEAISPGSAKSAAKVVPFITSLISPTSVVDVGCGTGVWIAEFKRCGVHDVMGIDGPYVDKSRLAFPPELFRSADLEKRIRVGRSFDLAISMEVAEHLRPARASSFVDDLADLAPIILFSAAAPVPGQGGQHHINEQWPSYWSAMFLRREFMPVDLRGRFWYDTDIEWWYRQNMLLFVRKDDLGRVAKASQSPLDIVHPNHPIYVAYQRPTLRFLLRSLPGAVARSVRARVFPKAGR